MQKAGDIYGHLIRHMENMNPDEVRRELLLSTIRFIDGHDIPRQTLNSLCHKVEVAVRSPDVCRHVVSIALWLERLGNTYYRRIQPNESPAKTSLDIIDSLYFDFNMKRFGIALSSTRFHIYILVGHTEFDWRSVRTVCLTYPKSTSVVIPDLGEVVWVNVAHDDISIRDAHGNYEVYNNIEEVIRSEGNKSNQRNWHP